MPTSNRLAADILSGFEALAAYANMGDQPDDWKRFRVMCPSFFPTSPTGLPWKGFESYSEWMYGFALEWNRDFADLPPERRPLPPLLWYRNRLRAVWSRNDGRGFNLAILLGFDDEANRIAKLYPAEVSVELLMKHVSPSDLGDLAKWKQGSSGLPAPVSKPDLSAFARLGDGVPQVDGLSGQIHWKFGCEFQQFLYELMKCRWRAKVCEQCGRFFVALKNAQRSCSIRCSADKKNKRALAWWNENGKERRARK